MKKIRFGIIGFGQIGTRYQQKIAENDQAQLVAVCDLKSEKLAQVNDPQVALVSKYSELIENPNVDVVVVATPNFEHKDMTIAALKAGKHVVCEKPMALTVTDANQMILAAQHAKGHLFVVKQNRVNPPVKKVKQLMDDGNLGEIGLVVVNCFWNRNDDYYLSSDWKGKMAKDGGTLFTQFSHFVDIIYYLFGDFKSVFALNTNFAHSDTIEFEDTGVVSFSLMNGAIGALNYTTGSYQQNMEGSVSIFGTKGTVKIGGQYLNTLEYYQIEGIKEITLEKGNAPNDYGTYKGSMSNHDKIVDNVIQTIHGQAEVATSGFEGMQVVAIITSIYESMKTGQAVRVH